MTKTTLYITLLLILVLSIIIWFIFKRNYFNKHKYVRLVCYNKDMSIKVRYIKRENFNKNNEYLINEKHVFNFNGYTSIIVTEKAQESINPLDFESKYNADDYKTAMRSGLVKDAFNSIKVDKFDKVAMLLILNVIQLLAIVYLLYMTFGGAN